MSSPLDHLPIDLLIALQELMVAPRSGRAGEEARDRARKRATDAGFYLLAMSGKREDPAPIELDEAPPGVDAIELRFGSAG